MPARVESYPLSASREAWVIFDPFHRTYFDNKKGAWATANEIRNNDWKLAKPAETEISEVFYKPFLIIFRI
jgi:hypothetical protein